MARKEKKTSVLTHILHDWYVYLVLALALFALLWTWGHMANTEANIREEYQQYIEDCQARTNTPTFNITMFNITIPQVTT